MLFDYSTQIFIALSVITLTLVFLYIYFYRKKPEERVIQYQLNDNEYLPNPKSIIIDEVTYNYYQAGKGEDVLLIHGIGASSYIWRFIYKDLSEQYKVTAIDLPGFGFSSKDPSLSYGLDEQVQRLNQFIEKIKIKKVHLVGSSMGGALALWYSIKYPNQVNKVATISPATNPKLMLPLPPFATSFSKIFEMALNKHLIITIIRRVNANRKLITKEHIENCSLHYDGSTDAIKTFIASTKTIQDKRLPSQLCKTDKDVLILYGLKDKMVPRKYMLELQKVIKNVTYAEDQSSGHHSMEDSPAFILKNLKTFFEN